MGNDATGLVNHIEQYLLEHNMSGRAFSQRIGVDPSLWSKVKLRERQPGGHFLRAVAVEFPDLRPAVMAHLCTGDTTTHGGDDATD